MRLLLCLHCDDIIMAKPEATECYCGQSRIRQANVADIAYQGPAVVLTIANGKFRHLREDDEWPVTIKKLPKNHPHIKKVTGKDCGSRWGKARTRARRGLAAADGDTSKVFKNVRMEWED